LVKKLNYLEVYSKLVGISFFEVLNKRVYLRSASHTDLSFAVYILFFYVMQNAY